MHLLIYSVESGGYGGKRKQIFPNCTYIGCTNDILHLWEDPNVVVIKNTKTTQWVERLDHATKSY